MFFRDNDGAEISNPKSLAYSLTHMTVFVTAAMTNTKGNLEKSTIFKMDAFGKIEDYLKQPDFSWFSDLTVLPNGTILAW